MERKRQQTRENEDTKEVSATMAFSRSPGGHGQEDKGFCRGINGNFCFEESEGTLCVELLI